MTDAIENTRPAATATTTWMKLARAAAITMVVWSLVLQLVLAREVIPPVFVIGLIFLAAGPFLVGERRRFGLAFAIVTTILFMGNLSQIIDSLAEVSSAPGFILTLLSTAAAIAAVLAGLGAFFRWSAEGVRAAAVGTTAVFVVGAVASIGVAATTESDAQLASDVQVEAKQIEFAPDRITLGAGSSGVWVDNRDGVHHTFTIAQLGIDLEIPALKARRIDIAAAPGTYGFVCTVPGHEDMIGTLTITG